MKKATRSNASASGCLIGLGGIMFGLAIFILIPVLGWVFGPIIMLMAIAIGSKKPEKIWRCKHCKYIALR